MASSRQFKRSFDAEDILIVTIVFGHETEWELFCDRYSPTLEERFKHWRDVASRPDLKKRAEEIILDGIFLLATGQPVDVLIRFSIAEWSRRHAEGSVGAPELGLIEKLHRLSVVERIIKENDGSRAKEIVTKIMRELGVGERSAKSLKQMAEWSIKEQILEENSKAPLPKGRH